MTTRSKRLFAICAFLMIAMFAATGTGSSTLSLNAATERFRQRTCSLEGE